MAFSMHTNRRAAMSEINVTPLVDVMLVLLIIFMVTAPMMDQQGIPIDTPDAPGKELPQDQKTEDIVISVSPKGDIYVNDKQVQEDQLVGKITEATKGNPKTAVFLRGDKEVSYGSVMKIMGALGSAGIKNLSLITSPKEQDVKK
jgi:biopolymer transport protein TolR